MLFLMFLLMFTQNIRLAESGVGTTLFYKYNETGCWSESDIAKLHARRIFERLALPVVPPHKINNKYIRNTLNYYRKALNFVEKLDDQNVFILKESLADTIGAHLRGEVLPNVRFAYYAGYVPYKRVRQLHDLLEEMKTYLNTKGCGWSAPSKVPDWTNLTVIKVSTGFGKLFDPCTSLVTKRDTNNCIHIPSPVIDDEYEPATIALPFKTGGLVSLTSPTSENILLKFYTAATRCILRSSPQNCRHSDYVDFNNELWHWMKREIAPHLMDEKLYSALGGVLRIAAAVQNYGKGLSRRKTIEDDQERMTKWRPWERSCSSTVPGERDGSAFLYVGLVILAATAICALQICFYHVFGEGKACHCKGSAKPDEKDVGFVSILASPAMIAYNVQNDKKVKNSTSSHCSVKTQKVYDLNENTEKMMDVIMSDNEYSEASPSPSPKELSSEEVLEKHIVEVGRSRSPPKIDPDISQLCRTPRVKQYRVPKFAASVTSRSAALGRRPTRPQSASGSTSSAQSVSSTSSRSRHRKSGRSHDLEWACRVISKSKRGKNSNSAGTELDIYSFTTPPSDRQLT